MASITIKSFSGLHDTNSDLSAVPEGAAELAENVVLLKYNKLEPRPGFSWNGTLNQHITDTGMLNQYGWLPSDRFYPVFDVSQIGGYEFYLKLDAFLAYKTGTSYGVIKHLRNASPYNPFEPYRVWYLNDTYRYPYILNLNGVPYLFSTGTESEGALACEVVLPLSGSSSKPYLRDAGVPRPSEIETSDYGTTGGVFAANDMVAYRAHFLYRSSNGAFIKGGVTGQRQHIFTAANPQCAVTIFWKKIEVAPDEAGRFFMQLYRSKISQTTPDDELQLVYEKEITADDMRLGYVTIIDNTSDAFLGEYIYTASAISGIVADKARPPIAMTHAEFNNALFMGSVKEVELEYDLTLIGVSYGTPIAGSDIKPWGTGIYAAATIEEGGNMWVGCSNGAVYKHNGVSWTTISTGLDGTNPVTDMIRYNGEIIIFTSNASVGGRIWRVAPGTLAITEVSHTNSSARPSYWGGAVIDDTLYFLAQGTLVGANGTWIKKLSGLTVSDVRALDTTNTILYQVRDGSMIGGRYSEYLPSGSEQQGLFVSSYVGSSVYVHFVDLATLAVSQLYTVSHTNVAAARLYKHEVLKDSTSYGFYLYLEGTTAQVFSSIRRIYATSGGQFGDGVYTGPSMMGIRSLKEANGYLIAGLSMASGVASSIISWDEPLISAAQTPKTIVTASTATQSLLPGYANSYLYLLARTNTTTHYAAVRPFGGLEIDDKISILGTTFKAHASDDPLLNYFAIDTASLSASVRIAATAKSLVRAINRAFYYLTASYVSTSAGLPGKIKLRGGLRSDRPAGIYSSRISAFSPDVTFRNRGEAPNGEPSYNTIAFSALYEYHAFPKVNRLQVGAPSEKILKIVAAKNTLFIVKETSVWALRGNSPQNYFLERIDDTVQCIAPDSVALVNGTIYFLSNRGLVAVDDRGAEIVGQHFSMMLDRQPRLNYQNAYGFAVEKNAWYCLCMVDPQNAAKRITLVYHVLNNRVTTMRHSLPMKRGSVYTDPVTRNEKILFYPEESASNFAPGFYVEERVNPGPNYYQNFYDESVEIRAGIARPDLGAGFFNVTLDAQQTEPQTGTVIDYFDWDIFYPVYGTISSVVSIGTPGQRAIKVLWNDGALRTPVNGEWLTAKRTFDSRYKFTPNFAGDAGIDKNWQTVSVFFENLPNGPITGNFNSEKFNSSGSQPETVWFNVDEIKPRRVKLGVPRAAARSRSLTFELLVKNHGTRWQVSAVTYELAGGSNK